MATILKAGNVASGAQITSDATGILEIRTGTGAGTTAITVGTDQAVTFAAGTTVSSLTTSGAVSAGSLTVNSNNISAVNSLGFRNRIINGAMMIDQRNNGASVTMNPNVNGNMFTVDRFRTGFFGTTYSSTAATLQQVTDAPTGFVNSLKITSTSTITPDANKLGAFMVQNIEGFNVADLGWGAAGAVTVTISFWVKASKTGTMSVSLENGATTRSYLTTVSISAANTWEFKTVTIAGDTTGTWEKGTSNGVSVTFGLMTNGSWLAGTGGSWSGTRALLSTSQTNFIATNGDNISITGVQLEAGSVATPFERRDYGRELIMAQRYFRFAGGGTGRATSSSATEIIQMLSPQMRATPSATLVSGTDAVLEPGIAFRAITGVSVAGGVNNNNAVLLGTSGSTGMTTGNVVLTPGNNGISLSAEL